MVVPEINSKARNSSPLGVPEALYSHEGAMGYTIDEFLSCYKTTCQLTQMEYNGSVYTCGVSYSTSITLELIE